MKQALKEKRCVRVEGGGGAGGGVGGWRVELYSVETDKTEVTSPLALTSNKPTKQTVINAHVKIEGGIIMNRPKTNKYNQSKPKQTDRHI